MFPFLARGLRESFELDSTAAYSAMDEHTTALLASFLACIYGDLATLAITDACACTGACAVVLARQSAPSTPWSSTRAAARRSARTFCCAELT